MNPELRMLLGRLKLVFIALVQRYFPRRLWRLVPGSSRQFGPPRRYSTWRDFHGCAAGTDWKQVYPAYQRLLPDAFLPLPAGYQQPANNTCRFPAPGIATIVQARVLGADGWVVGANDPFLQDSQFGARPRQRVSDVYRRWFYRPVRHLPGRTLNLCLTVMV